MTVTRPLLEATVGIGWRPEIAGVVAGLPGLRFCEVVAENLDPRALPETLAALVTRGVTVVPHGISLSLGGAEPLDLARVEHLGAVAGAVGAPLVSDHVAFVRAGGLEAGHLLPVERSREMLEVLVENVQLAQQHLPVPLALEPIATLVEWPAAELSEGAFLTELLDRTGALLVLDVANVHANAVNRGTDPVAEIAAMPLERVAYCHVAGGTVDHEGLYHDTHAAAVLPEVLDLLSVTLDRCRARGCDPAVMLERDDHFPAASEITGELDVIADAARRPRVT
ncbi:DUF692 domain-containing protein [Jatrophihabitans sp. YIM 134969]